MEIYFVLIYYQHTPLVDSRKAAEQSQLEQVYRTIYPFPVSFVAGHASIRRMGCFIINLTFLPKKNQMGITKVVFLYDPYIHLINGESP